MVEAGLILPLLMFLVFGIIEIGGLLSTYSATANAVRAGGRMASVQGSDSTADQATLERIAQEGTAIRNGEIRYIIVWHAAGPTSTVPSECVGTADALGAANSTSQGRSVSGPGDCNIYAYPQADGGAFDMALGQATNPDPAFYFGCSGAGDPEAAHKVDCNWPGLVRETVISPRGVTPRVEPDYVGIYVRVEYQYLTGLLGSIRTITDNSITLLEPDNFEES
jgi:TadE-like protein